MANSKKIANELFARLGEAGEQLTYRQKICVRRLIRINSQGPFVALLVNTAPWIFWSLLAFTLPLFFFADSSNANSAEFLRSISFALFIFGLSELMSVKIFSSVLRLERELANRIGSRLLKPAPSVFAEHTANPTLGQSFYMIGFSLIALATVLYVISIIRSPGTFTDMEMAAAFISFSIGFLHHAYVESWYRAQRREIAKVLGFLTVKSAD